MHICFILDNSLTMAQKSANNLSLLDQAKSSVEFVFRSLIRSNKFTAQDIIHLYITSSVDPLSSFQHSQLHFLHQLKSIQFNILTYPAQVISSALNQIGKFRALNQSQTLLGYRQGTIFQPCLIVFITDRSSVKHLKKIYNYLSQKKFAMRSEYQFLTIKFCSPSPSERNIYTFQAFKTRVESQKQSKMSKQIMRKMNGRLKFAYSSQQLNQVIQKSIQNFKPYLFMEISNKQYKIYSKDFSKSSVQFLHSKKLFEQLQNQQKYFQNSQKQDNIKIMTEPTKKRSLIPLPFQTSSKWCNNQHNFDKFFNIKLYVDFSKQLANSMQLKNSNFFIDKYNILNNAYLKKIQLHLSSDKIWRFPLFYEKKNQQHLIGYVQHFKFKKSQHFSTNQQYTHSKQQSYWCLNISFANFTSLVCNLKLLYENNKTANVNQLFQNYVSTLPIIYIKFIQSFLQPFKLSISYDMFQNINHTSFGINNSKLYELRGNQKKTMNASYWKSKQIHQKSQSECCSIYSKNFGKFQMNYSQNYQQKSQFQNKLSQFFYKNIKQFTQCKKKLGIQDYLTIRQVQSLPISKQVQKYNIRRGDDDFNQNATTGFGNPFKKKRKLNPDQTQSSQYFQNSQQLKFADDIVQYLQIKQTDQIKLIEKEQLEFIQSKEKQIIQSQKMINQDLSKSKIQERHQIQQEVQKNIQEIKNHQIQIKSNFQINKFQNQLNQTTNNKSSQKGKNISILTFVNKFSVTKPVLLKINLKNLNNMLFERNFKIIQEQKLKHKSN